MNIIRLIEGTVVKLSGAAPVRLHAYEHKRILRPARWRFGRSIPPDLAHDPNAAWVHMAREGAWKGHHQGELSLTRAMFDEVKATFDRQVTPVPVKYEHPVQAGGEPIPSAGKIYAIDVRESGLWGFVLFTDSAAEMVREREYQYCSVVMLTESIDRVTGESIGAELLELGLTDNPFIDGLTPISLQARAA